jgi:hypothetical protein
MDFHGRPFSWMITVSHYVVQHRHVYLSVSTTVVGCVRTHVASLWHLTMMNRGSHIPYMLTRDEWTRGPGTPPVVKGLVWCTDGSKVEGTSAGVYGQSLGRRLNIALRNHATVFQAEVLRICDISLCL